MRVSRARAQALREGGELMSQRPGRCRRCVSVPAPGRKHCAGCLEKLKAEQRLYRADDPVGCAARAHAYDRARQARDPKRYNRNREGLMLHKAKRRALDLGVPFNITRADIQIPDTCPILGIRLAAGDGVSRDSSPSLDRIIPEMGYVPGNVAVISQRANQIKNSGTADEHDMIARWIRTEDPRVSKAAE